MLSYHFNSPREAIHIHAHSEPYTSTVRDGSAGRLNSILKLHRLFDYFRSIDRTSMGVQIATKVLLSADPDLNIGVITILSPVPLRSITSSSALHIFSFFRTPSTFAPISGGPGDDMVLLSDREPVDVKPI